MLYRQPGAAADLVANAAGVPSPSGRTLRWLPRGIGSFLMMPLVGVIIPKGDARKLLGLGMFTCAADHVRVRPAEPERRLLGLLLAAVRSRDLAGLLFVPLTTVSMGPIPRSRWATRRVSFNLLRNLGGSFGIAVSTTLVARHEQVYTNVLGAHVTPYSSGSYAALHGLRSSLEARGSDPVTAARQSYVMMFGLVERHAAILSFLDVFRLLGVIFLLALPLVLLMKKPRRHAQWRIRRTSAAD